MFESYYEYSMSKLASILETTGLSHLLHGTLLARIFNFPINIQSLSYFRWLASFLQEKTVLGNLPRFLGRDFALGSRSCGPVTQGTSDNYTANSANPAAVLLEEISSSSKNKNGRGHTQKVDVKLAKAHSTSAALSGQPQIIMISSRLLIEGFKLSAGHQVVTLLLLSAQHPPNINDRRTFLDTMWCIAGERTGHLRLVSCSFSQGRSDRSSP
jgi:hypothetical protein